MTNSLRILFIGDIVGEAGRMMIQKHVRGLREYGQLDVVVANGENMAGGFGMTQSTYLEVTQAGVDIVTGGNHTFDKAEGIKVLEEEPYALRPANFPSGTPGHGHVLYTNSKGQKIGILNIMGRTFMEAMDCPFRKADELLPALKEKTKVILVDFHAEATSEKAAMAWHLDGRVSFVVGTHTHVPTGDERILPGGTGFMTDAGMTGPYDSVIGVKKEIILQRFITKRGKKFEVASGDPWLCGVLFEVDQDTGQTLKVQKIRIEQTKPETFPENTQFL